MNGFPCQLGYHAMCLGTATQGGVEIHCHCVCHTMAAE